MKTRNLLLVVLVFLISTLSVATDTAPNGQPISVQTGTGDSIAAFPDVCFTPPMNIVTPPGVPIPSTTIAAAGKILDEVKKSASAYKEEVPKKGIASKKQRDDAMKALTRVSALVRQARAIVNAAQAGDKSGKFGPQFMAVLKKMRSVSYPTLLRQRIVPKKSKK